MGRTGDDQKLIGHNGLYHQCRLVDPAFDETDLRQTVEHRLCEIVFVLPISNRTLTPR